MEKPGQKHRRKHLRSISDDREGWKRDEAACQQLKPRQTGQDATPPSVRVHHQPSPPTTQTSHEAGWESWRWLETGGAPPPLRLLVRPQAQDTRDAADHGSPPRTSHPRSCGDQQEALMLARTPTGGPRQTLCDPPPVDRDPPPFRKQIIRFKAVCSTSRWVSSLA